MIAARVADFVSSASFAPEDDVVHAARRHLLDGIGNAIAARRQDAGAPAVQVAQALGGKPEAFVLGGRERISAPAAALATGVLVHALDFDDTHGTALVHAGAIALPAALSVGQETGASGRDVLEASAVGLELACRLGAAVPHGFHQRGLHATAVVGPLVAATVAGRLLGFSPARLIDALGIAGSSSGGLLEFLDTGSDTKILHPGTASMNGVIAARLAAAGASGPGSVLEGRRGLYATLSSVTPDLDGIVDDLGSRWEATRIGIKPYPNCQLMHVTLDAVAAADTDGVDPADIVGITADVHPDSLSIVGDVRPGNVPLSTYDAKFDLRWSLAALLHEGNVSARTYSDDVLGRREIAETAGRVELRARRSDGPAANAPGTVTIRTRQGEEIVGSVGSSRGTVANPLTDFELRTKFATNCGGAAGQSLADAIWHLDEHPDLGQLFEGAAELSERN